MKTNINIENINRDYMMRKDFNAKNCLSKRQVKFALIYSFLVPFFSQLDLMCRTGQFMLGDYTKYSQILYDMSLFASIPFVPLGYIAGDFLLQSISINSAFLPIALYVVILIQVLLIIYFFNYKKQNKKTKSYFGNHKYSSVYK